MRDDGPYCVDSPGGCCDDPDDTLTRPCIRCSSDCLPHQLHESMAGMCIRCGDEESGEEVRL